VNPTSKIPLTSSSNRSSDRISPTERPGLRTHDWIAAERCTDIAVANRRAKAKSTNSPGDFGGFQITEPSSKKSPFHTTMTTIIVDHRIGIPWWVGTAVEDPRGKKPDNRISSRSRSGFRKLQNTIVAGHSRLEWTTRIPF